jgi:NADPH2:quinone reductase
MLLPETAPAVVATRTGGVEVLELQELPVSEPGPGQVLVAVAAVGVNFIDVYQREGLYPMPTPFVMGNEAAGEVVATGPDVTELVVGDRVAWAMHAGSAQAYATVPASVCALVRPDVTLDMAAAAMLQGMTAQYLTTSTYAITAGTMALVHAAAGGVGQLLVQMVKARGGTVIATAGTDEKVAVALALGADRAVNYSEVDDLAAAVIDATGGRGVHVAYDGVGRATFDASLSSLRRRGMMVLFGAASGPVPPFDLQRLNSSGSLFITRPSLGHYISDHAELLERSEAMLGAIAGGTLRVQVSGRYPFAEAAAAYTALESRQTKGKLLLLP